MTRPKVKVYRSLTEFKNDSAHEFARGKPGSTKRKHYEKTRKQAAKNVVKKYKRFPRSLLNPPTDPGNPEQMLEGGPKQLSRYKANVRREMRRISPSLFGKKKGKQND